MLLWQFLPLGDPMTAGSQRTRPEESHHHHHDIDTDNDDDDDEYELRP